MVTLKQNIFAFGLITRAKCSSDLGNPSKKKKKKNVENSTFGGGSGPGHFPHLKKKQNVFKMHSKLF